jgi:hypothetical protein
LSTTAAERAGEARQAVSRQGSPQATRSAGLDAPLSRSAGLQGWTRNPADRSEPVDFSLLRAKRAVDLASEELERCAHHLWVVVLALVNRVGTQALRVALGKRVKRRSESCAGWCSDAGARRALATATCAGASDGG